MTDIDLAEGQRDTASAEGHRADYRYRMIMRGLKCLQQPSRPALVDTKSSFLQ
jgi:hypothetical protein